ncbi:hypothetical protein ACFUVV_17520 [Streptomyces sp. NPDC057376]|uniref:hypothetical protein n=1 Tax=Streptomyces sp. NPDC057376 TaxID=3346110 RepID=UPI00362BE07F
MLRDWERWEDARETLLNAAEAAGFPGHLPCVMCGKWHAPEEIQFADAQVVRDRTGITFYVDKAAEDGTKGYRRAKRRPARDVTLCRSHYEALMWRTVWREGIDD